MIQKVTVGNLNRYLKLNTAVAPVPIMGGDMAVTAKLLEVWTQPNSNAPKSRHGRLPNLAMRRPTTS